MLANRETTWVVYTPIAMGGWRCTAMVRTISTYLLISHCVKHPYSEFFRSMFSCIQTECGEILWKKPVSEFSFVGIFPHLDWIQRDTKYLSIFSPNAGRYKPENLWIRTLFTQWLISKQVDIVRTIVGTSSTTHLDISLIPHKYFWMIAMSHKTLILKPCHGQFVNQCQLFPNR